MEHMCSLGVGEQLLHVRATQFTTEVHSTRHCETLTNTFHKKEVWTTSFTNTVHATRHCEILATPFTSGSLDITTRKQSPFGEARGTRDAERAARRSLVVREHLQHVVLEVAHLLRRRRVRHARVRFELGRDARRRQCVV